MAPGASLPLSLSPSLIPSTSSLALRIAPGPGGARANDVPRRGARHLDCKSLLPMVLRYQVACNKLRSFTPN